MKNLPIILNIILFALVGHLYYLNTKKSAGGPAEGASGAQQGARIAFIRGDSLDTQYVWLKEQKAAIDKRMEEEEKRLSDKQENLMREAKALQRKFQEGNMTKAEAEQQQANLMERGQRLEDEKMALNKTLGEEQKKAFNDLYANIEEKLKVLSDQLGYDYILSYSRGGQILLANDQMDITKQVLDLLNAKDK